MLRRKNGKSNKKENIADKGAKGTTVFKILFFTVFVFSLLLGAYLIKTLNNDYNEHNNAIKYIDNWTVTDSYGNSFEAGRTYNDERALSEDFTIISVLPDNIYNNSLLCFSNRSDVSVYIGGELRKDFIRARDVRVPWGSLKDFYISVPLTSSDSGAEVKIIKYKTDWHPVVISETFVTTYEGMYVYVSNKYGLSFIMSVILLILALFVCIIGFIMRIWFRQPMDMLYASLGILDVALWLISVSQLTPFVTGIYYADGIMGFIFCMLMPFSLLIYINSIQNKRYSKCYSSLFILSLVSFVLWTALHFMGIQSFQTSLIYIDTVLGATVISVLVTLIIDTINGYIKEYHYTALGLYVFLFMSVAEIITLLFFELKSSELPMLIGLLFLLVFVVFQQIDDIGKVRNRLEEEVKRKIIENEQMLVHIVQTLAGTIDAKDTYTNGHSSRVADYSREIAKRFGYDDSALNDIYMMGLLHDIGKIGIPDAIINKPGKLTDEEFELIKNHPIMSDNILRNIKEKPELSMGARWHHERFGGGGYPDGIKGEDIPEQARIIAVADAYDAMTSCRSYRDPMPQEKKLKNRLKKAKEHSLTRALLILCWI